MTCYHPLLKTLLNAQKNHRRWLTTSRYINEEGDAALKQLPRARKRVASALEALEKRLHETQRNEDFE